jgi:hypothetical protein
MRIELPFENVLRLSHSLRAAIVSLPQTCDTEGDTESDTGSDTGCTREFPKRTDLKQRVAAVWLVLRGFRGEPEQRNSDPRVRHGYGKPPCFTFYVDRLCFEVLPLLMSSTASVLESHRRL